MQVLWTHMSMAGCRGTMGQPTMWTAGHGGCPVSVSAWGVVCPVLVSLVVIPALRLVGELREAPALSEQYCATSRGIVWNA